MGTQAGMRGRMISVPPSSRRRWTRRSRTPTRSGQSSSRACRRALRLTTPNGLPDTDRLIFVFSVVLDLEEDFDTRDYPTEAAARATADLRNRLVGTKVDHWGVYVVTVTGRARSSSDDCPRRTPQARGVACGHRKSPHEGWVPWSHPVSFISTSTSSLSCRL